MIASGEEGLSEAHCVDVKVARVTADMLSPDG